MNTHRKILLIDDDLEILDLIRVQFEFQGLYVTATHSSREFQHFFKTVKPDICLSDVQLKDGMNGFELLVWVKEISSQTPFVLISGMATPETKRRAWKLGADAFLEKPLDPNVLLKHVQELIEDNAGIHQHALVVDDHQATRESLAEYLTSQGWIVQTAPNGEKAVKIVKSSPRPFKVALVDLVMPRMNGLQTMRQIKEECPTTYCIAVTGEATAEEMSQVYDYGGSGIISKPVEQNQLIKFLEEAKRPNKPPSQYPCRG